jgi:hypothetical protein
MSENEVPVTDTPNQQNASNVLNPVTRTVVERCIQEVLLEYVQQTKQFTADSMHYIRMRVTDIVKQRLGDDQITSVDIGLDLSKLEDIPFFFKLNIPQDKAETHLVKPSETPPPGPQ